MKKDMKLHELLGIMPGVTSVIGGGGKTTLLHALARELTEKGTVLLTTSTRMYPSAEYPVLLSPDAEQLRQALLKSRAVCTGRMGDGAKLTAPELSFGEMARLADYVLVEADGSRGLPIKAHAHYEPVIPRETLRTVLVVGADGFGAPIREKCHRPELYAVLTGEPEEGIITPETQARLIRAEGLGDIIFVNKAEDCLTLEQARSLAGLTRLPVAAGSLQRGTYILISEGK